MLTFFHFSSPGFIEQARAKFEGEYQFGFEISINAADGVVRVSVPGPHPDVLGEVSPFYFPSLSLFHLRFFVLDSL